MPPVVLDFDLKVGYYVRAAIDLLPFTLVCEYIGQVRTCEQSQSVVNDSIMELLSVPDKNSKNAEDPKLSLVVIPAKFANVARFFNGINNSEKGSKQLKQNLRTMRV